MNLVKTPFIRKKNQNFHQGLHDVLSPLLRMQENHQITTIISQHQDYFLAVLC